MSLEREMIDACCDPTCYHMQRNKAFKEARAACIAELLSDPQGESDRAHDQAVRDCVTAIEGLMKHQVKAAPEVQGAPSRSEAAQIHPGWKLVPHEPTKEMIEAGNEQYNRMMWMKDYWQAMWHAAPDCSTSKENP